MRPTRIDVQWTYLCDESLTPDEVIEHIEDADNPNHTRTGFSIGVSGQAGVNTRYVGSTASERRVRFYRKDRESPFWAAEFGPCMRCEVTLKGDHAREFWAVWAEGSHAAFAVAAAHVGHMTGGLPVRPEVGEVPEIQPKPEADEAERLFQFIEQHGQQMTALFDAGIDIEGLARLRASKANRMGAFRMKRRREAIERAGVDEVMESVCGLLTN